MRTFKLLCLAAFLAMSAMFAAATIGPAKADTVTEYKQTIGSRIMLWANRVTKAAGDYNSAYAALAVLNVQTPPPPDADAKIKDLMAKMMAARDTIYRETKFLQLDLKERTITPPNPNDGKSLADFVNNMIKQQGATFGPSITVMPSLNWDLRSGKLGGVAGEIQVTFK